MKKIFLFLGFVVLSAALFATQTTYTFYDKQWSSKVGTVKVSVTDGWVCDVAGADYSEGKQTPQGYMYAGVQVTSGDAYKNAGATSVLSFTDIRRLVFNYRTNASKGKGTLYVQIGDNEPVATQIERPEKSKGELNRDLEIPLPQVQSGKIRFWIDCTENSIYINTISIRAKDGSPNIGGLTADVFTLVTDAAELQDGDEVIFGVSGNQHNYIMGLYDPYNSRNNIYALRATYSPDRQTVNEQADAVYTLYKGSSDIGDYFVIADVDGYVLVASGGNPNHNENNYLTIWDDIYSNSYGYYGAWTISVDVTGEASVENLGVSRSNKLQFNLNGGTPIFSCYSTWSQTRPAIYRRVTIDDPTAPYISTTMCNFGTVLMDNGVAEGSKLVEVNTANLTEDLQCYLLHGDAFTLDRSTLDRDGDVLNISFSISEPGDYRDTLIISSSEIETRVSVIARIDRRLTIREACSLYDFVQCTLEPVVITKKYDKYIFVHDDTGDMLLFDGGNLYAKDRKNGDVLTEVTGRFKNYYGNPELNLSAQFQYKAGQPVAPEVVMSKPDSADVCRYLRFENVQYADKNTLLIGSEQLPIYDLFKYQSQTPVSVGDSYNVEGFVYYYNEVVFCPSKIERVASAVEQQNEQLAFLVTPDRIINTQRLPLQLYTADGKLLCDTRSDISLGDLPSGTYIVRCGVQSEVFVR